MRIDQRRVTVINLQDDLMREVYVHSEGQGYCLGFVSENEVVNVLLSVDDLEKLRRELVKTDSMGDSEQGFDFAEMDDVENEPLFDSEETYEPFADSEAAESQAPEQTYEPFTDSQNAHHRNGHARRRTYELRHAWEELDWLSFN